MRRARWVLRIIGMVLFLLLAAATYQGTRTALERRAFPAPGHLVEVGDHQLHIRCTGEGEPVVVLEAPAAGASVAWAWVQPEVARITRVCSYDRAGLGWSWRPEGEYDPAAAPRELRQLLQGEQGPFVIVGQGFGAALARVFASQNPDTVAALVLVDDPTQVAASEADGFVTRSPELWPWLARFGVLRVDRELSRAADGLPEPQGGALVAFLNRPDHLMQAARELSWQRQIVASAADAPLPDVPVAHIDVAGGRRMAFLADRDAASRVAALIVQTLQQVR